MSKNFRKNTSIRPLDLMVSTFCVLIQFRALFPELAKWIPRYDMFTRPVPTPPRRVIAVVKLQDGSDIELPAHRILPLEFPRNGSIALEAIRYGYSDRLSVSLIQAHNRGWCGFYQVPKSLQLPNNSPIVSVTFEVKESDCLEVI